MFHLVELCRSGDYNYSKYSISVIEHMLVILLQQVTNRPINTNRDVNYRLNNEKRLVFKLFFQS